MTEHVLEYTAKERIQDNYYWCGPTSTHMVLSTGGIDMDEAQCASELDTTVDGTADINNVLEVLRNHLPQDDWQAVHMPNDPPTDYDRETLWANIVWSINAGRGVVINIEVPPSNYPIGVKGSATPAYGGGTVFHYIAAMGYDDDGRAVFIADPGFRPFSYWVTLDQLATMIPPKGYAYSANPIPTTPPPGGNTVATNQEKFDAIYDKICAYPDDANIGGVWETRSRYAPEPKAKVDDTVGMMLYTDANVFDLMVEFAASQGYEPARQMISDRAKAHPDDGQAAFYAEKYPTKSK